MRAQEQKCPYCGARLVPERGLSTFFCQYCGGRIQVDDSDKRNIELRKMEHEETIRQLENAHDSRTMDHIERVQAAANSQERYRMRNKNRGGFGKGCLTVILALIVGFVVLTIIGIVLSNRGLRSIDSDDLSDAEKLARHYKEVERLTGIEQEVLADIEKGDYNHALAKANTIHYTLPEYMGIGVYGSLRQWENRREEIVRSIYQISGMGTPTPPPVPDPVYMEGASEKTTWPKAAIARYIPVPASDDIEISWERETGFYLEVKDFSKVNFAVYCDMCWDMGFTLNYEKGDSYFRAGHAAGFSLSLSYRGSTMSVRLEKSE